MNRILIAVDGSPAAAVAARFGLELAVEQHAEPAFVFVAPAVDVVPTGGFALTAALPHEVTAADRRPLEDAVALAAELGLTARAELLRGDPVDEIVSFADSLEADLIVVGSRGHGALASALLGSVSRGILSETRRPVLVVRGASARVPATAATA
jgi:nucleotide-binding universal stress UspA family protein